MSNNIKYCFGFNGQLPTIFDCGNKVLEISLAQKRIKDTQINVIHAISLELEQLWQKAILVQKFQFSNKPLMIFR